MVAASSPVPALAVRSLLPGDEAFLFDTWLRSCRKCERHRHLPAGVYFGDVHRQIESIIASAMVTVTMAVDVERLVGFIATERLGGATRILHYAYTKGPDRQKGVFGHLAHAVGLDLARPFYYVSHPPMASVMARRFPAAVYRPDILGMPR